jgi:putative hydrolase of the HAD superfamily
VKPAPGRQHLLIDADDTLWENNIYFEAAFERFVDYLEHSTLTAPEVRSILDEIELANIKVHGYGSLNFARNLAQCYERLAERVVRPEDVERVKGFALEILEQPVEIIAGVPETLEYLASRHDLTLFTKGHPEEQKLKIDRSGLGIYFGHTAIVKEKDAQAYAKLAAERGLDPARTWMIGNSPKSDINPALEAGLNAVFVPHARTWALEKQALASPGQRQLLVVEEFAGLREIF